MGRSPHRAASLFPQRMGTVTVAAKIPLVGLAAAAAARLVGIGRAGPAVGRRRWAGRDTGRRQQFAGATFPGLLHTPDPALSVAWHRTLCRLRTCPRYLSKKLPTRRGT